MKNRLDSGAKLSLIPSYYGADEVWQKQCREGWIPQWQYVVRVLGS
jgi:hypothetical protein